MISCIFECGKSFFSLDLCAGKVSISLPVYISLGIWLNNQNERCGTWWVWIKDGAGQRQNIFGLKILVSKIFLSLKKGF